MAKGMGPLLLLGGAAALALASRGKKKSTPEHEGEIVAQGQRANAMNIPKYYQIRTAAGIPGFAQGEGNVAYIPEIATARDYERDIWIALGPESTIEAAEDAALSELAEEGFDREL